MKKVIFNPENPNGLEVELTADEVSQVQAKIDAKEAKATLKESAKAKLVAGEALTEEEANTIVI